MLQVAETDYVRIDGGAVKGLIANNWGSLILVT